MKNSTKLFGIIALAAVMTFAMIACSDGGGGGPRDSTDLGPQDITYVSYDSDNNKYELVITDKADAKAIRAAYTPKNGDKFLLTITNIAGDIIGKSEGSITIEAKDGSSITFTLTSKDETVFSVTVSSNSSGSDGKIDVIKADNGIPNELGQPIPAPADLTPDPIPPEDLEDQTKRWYKWEIDSTATLVYSFEPDGALKITIGGVPQVNNETDGWGKWRAAILYNYTAKAGISNEYKFEAWTESGTRVLNVEYYGDLPNNTFLGKDVTITSERKTYTIKGQRIPKSKVQSLGFRGADQLGTFYLKMLSIEEYTPELEYELINEQNNPNNDTYRVVSAIGMSGSVVIPASYNGKPVTEIDDRAFEKTNITSVTIPSSVTYIGIDTFSECNNLTTVTFAEGSQLQIIADWAFSNSPNIKSITIPSSVMFVYLGAFQDWTSSQTINVPFASETAADNAWGNGWRLGCNATIVYQP